MNVKLDGCTYILTFPRPSIYPCMQSRMQQTDKQAGRQTPSQTNRQTDRQTETGRQAGRLAGKQIQNERLFASRSHTRRTKNVNMKKLVTNDIKIVVLYTCAFIRRLLLVTFFC